MSIEKLKRETFLEMANSGEIAHNSDNEKWVNILIQIGADFMQKEYEEKLRWITVKYTRFGYISEESKKQMIDSIPFNLKYDNGFIEIIENKNDIVEFSGAIEFRSVFL